MYIVSVCRFESEVQRWSDSGHDIIIIAKEMCSMMVDMSDFTRYPTNHGLMPIEPKALRIIHILHIWQSLLTSSLTALRHRGLGQLKTAMDLIVTAKVCIPHQS